MKKLSDYDKIMQILDAKGVSPNQAEIDIGVKTGVIGKLRSRRKGYGRMHADNTDKFIRTFKVNRKWWDSGEGEMFITEPEKQEPESGTITMDREVWGVIKLSTEVLGMEFKNLWGLIHSFAPPGLPLEKDPIKTPENGGKNK